MNIIAAVSNNIEHRPLKKGILLSHNLFTFIEMNDHFYSICANIFSYEIRLRALLLTFPVCRNRKVDRRWSLVGPISVSPVPSSTTYKLTISSSFDAQFYANWGRYCWYCYQKNIEKDHFYVLPFSFWPVYRCCFPYNTSIYSL